MIKLDRTYSDYTDINDEKYPGGKAINASSSESFDGTPILADLVNDFAGFFQALVTDAQGSLAGISGYPENIQRSDVLLALKKLITDPDAAHAALRGVKAHGATVDAQAGQLITRDENGRAQVAAPSAAADIARKAEVDEEAGARAGVQANLNTHTSNKSNPHVVTKSQVGLGSVPNVSTNDQAPTYTDASTVTKLTSGEKLSVAFGKIAKAISGFISHLADKSNPHVVTKSQVGLGSCDNTADANKSVNYAASAGSAANSDKVDGYHAGSAAGMLIPVAAYSFGESSGYIKWANGLIVQAGKVYINYDAQQFAYPLAFSSAVLGVGAVPLRTDSNFPSGLFTLYNATLSGGTFRTVCSDSNMKDGTYCSFVAVGI